MTIEETLALLAFAAHFDRRTVGESDARAWQLVAATEGWTFVLASRAVLEHYANKRDFLMPADITTRIMAARKAVYASFQIPPHSAELADDGPAFVAWAKERAAEHMAVGLAAWAESGRLPVPLELEA